MTVVRADREETPGYYKHGEAVHGKQFRMKGSSGALVSALCAYVSHGQRKCFSDQTFLIPRSHQTRNLR